MTRQLLLGFTLVLGAVALTPGTAVAGPELRVLTDRTESHLAPIFAAYRNATGVTVKAVYLEKGLLSRLESRPTEADLVITKDVDLLELAKRKKLLAPLSSDRIRRAVPAAFRDADGMYFSDSYRARVIFYARDRVKPEELSTYEALADKKWRGRICLRSGYHDYNLSLFGQMLSVWGRERTLRLLSGLSKNLGRTPSGADRDQVRAIYEKKCDLAIANSYYMGIMLSSPTQRAWGLATGVFFPDQASGGTFILRSGLGLTKATSNVKAATAFLQRVVSREVQDLIAQHTFAYPVISAPSTMPPINRELGRGQAGIKDGLFKLRVVPPARFADQRDAVIRLLDGLKFDRPR